jgi:dCTP deaminase
VIVNTTPIEPGFQGQVVIEISNATSLPVKVYVNEGIAQFLFFQGAAECNVSYADRGGKYQGQRGIVVPKV